MRVSVAFQEGIEALGQTPRKTVVSFTVGHHLLEVAQAHGIPLNAPCGGRGTCGKCLVRVLGGGVAASDADRALLGEGMIAEGLRLACQARPKLGLVVEVQTRFDVHAAPTLLPAPGLDPSRRPARVALAVDLGSTSVQMRVLDADTGTLAGEASLLNRQVRRGHDVMTRMTHALRGPEAHAELVEDGRETLRELWRAASSALAAPGAEPVRWVVAGNSVMTTLLWGERIDGLAEAPYGPSFLGSREGPAAGAGLAGASLYTFPLLGSFVGGDTAAALLATDLDRDGPARMMIDIGTNTEVVLAHAGRLWACSTPAGPAFEGGNVSVGMRAEPGAITGIEVREDGALRARTIGGVKARGICGTGLIEVVMALVRAGLVGRDGTIRGEAGRVTLARGVDLLQADIRELQLAKGALRAATRVVLEKAGLRDRELAALLLAGAFGAHLQSSVAIEAGMVPGVEPSAVRSVGNASLDGATLMAREPAACAGRVEALRERIRHVELATHEDFQRLLVESLGF
jgi:uncharacterized 2Fe-2S/4Fe-4S cluster protein (DUF4445 family)